MIVIWLFYNKNQYNAMQCNAMQCNAILLYYCHLMKMESNLSLSCILFGLFMLSPVWCNDNSILFADLL